jgi:hypothetical protein
MSRLVLGFTQSPIQRVPGAASQWVKWQGCEADHSHAPRAEVKEEWSYAFTTPYIFMAWCLISTRDNLTFYFTSKDLLHFIKKYNLENRTCNLSVEKVTGTEICPRAI